MLTEVFIGKVKSEKFDFDKQGKWSGYYPEIIENSSKYDSELFWDIIGEKPKTKQVDWGCWVLKLNKTDLVAFLSRDKYQDNPSIAFLLDIAKGLNDEEDYLLVAFEDILM